MGVFRTHDDKQERYVAITDLTVLEAMEDQLVEQYDQDPNTEVTEELIHLYWRMWVLSPNETRFEPTISRLLMELGWDFKRRKVDFEKGRHFFEELIQLKKPKPVPIANYRLGFIHYHNGEWERAIGNFNRALNTFRHREPERQPEKWSLIDDSQRLKALSRLSLAHKRRSAEVARRAKEMFQTIEDPDSNMLYIDEIDNEILMDEQQQYAKFGDNGTSLLTEQELQNELRHESRFILDCTDHDHKYIRYMGGRYSISGPKLQLLMLLIHSRIPLNQRDVENRLIWTGQRVRTNVIRLREFLTECGLLEDPIRTDDGYKWVHPDYCCIYHRDDPQYLM